jgi:hypothetical protein
MLSILGSILGILFCGGLGALGAWLLVSGLGLSGVPAAIAAAVVAMAVAVALWVAGSALLRALGWHR